MNKRFTPSQQGVLIVMAITAALVLLLLAALIPFTLLREQAPAGIEAQSLPTLAPLASFTAAPPSTETAIPTPTLDPSITLVADESVIVHPGDSLRTIALAYQIPVEGLLMVNPWLRADTALLPGQVLRLPGPDALAALPPTAIPEGPSGTVITEDSDLFLRESPATDGTVILSIPSASPLRLTGRTESGDWLRVEYQGFEGWVLARWVRVESAYNEIPAITPAPESTVEPLPTASQPTLTPPPKRSTLAEGDAPTLSNLSPRAAEIFERGQRLGLNPGVFSKVGDSITDNDQFLVPFGTGDYDLGSYTYLQGVIDYYNATPLREGNSFSVESLAARRLWSAWYLLNFDMGNEEPCFRGETPLVCEYRLSRPAVALIMIGTNDVTNTSTIVYERFLREIIEYSIDQGVLPVVSTIPPLTVFEVGNKVEQINAIIRALAIEYGIPLWDYYAATQTLPNYGLSEDLVHPSYVDPGSFQPQYLTDGMNVRNLTALQALDAVWRGVIQPEE